MNFFPGEHSMLKLNSAQGQSLTHHCSAAGQREGCGMYSEKKCRLMAPACPSLPQKSCRSLNSAHTATHSPQHTLRALLARWEGTQPDFAALPTALCAASCSTKPGILCALLLLCIPRVSPVILSLQGQILPPARECSGPFSIFLHFLVPTKIGYWYFPALLIPV